ncbi:MAG: quinol:electron acceptor oxidoreductase subunit ActD, partial [Opitutales bacterium]
MSKPYAILALFETPQAIYAAAKEVRDAGYRQWDCLTPFPI